MSTEPRASWCNSTAIVQSIYGAIQEYAGIERPEWLGLPHRLHGSGRWRNG